MLHQGRNNAPVSFILGGARVATHLHVLLRLELRLHVTPVFTGPHPPGDLLLLLMPPSGLLSSLLLFGDRYLL